MEKMQEKGGGGFPPRESGMRLCRRRPAFAVYRKVVYDRAKKIKKEYRGKEKQVELGILGPKFDGAHDTMDKHPKRENDAEENDNGYEKNIRHHYPRNAHCATSLFVCLKIGRERVFPKTLPQ